MPEIEFVDPHSEPGPDEELVTGPRHAVGARPWTRRPVRIGAVAVVLAVAAAVTVGVLHHRGSGTPVAGSTSGVVLAPPGIAPSSSVDADAPPGAHPDTHRGSPSAVLSEVLALPPCPDVDACELQLDPPAPVVAAVRTWLVGATDVLGTSQLVTGRPPTLRTRNVTARDGRLSIRIRIAPAADAQRPSAMSSSSGSETTVTVIAVTGGLAVAVVISGPAAQVPGLPTARSLAADRRLVAVG